MNKAVGAVVFLLGAAIGSAIAWRYASQKYEKIAREEIDSVKETYGRRKHLSAKRRQETREMRKQIEDLGYQTAIIESEPMPLDNDTPYIITPEEFEEGDIYETLGMTYYADKTLTDDNDDPVAEEDIYGLIGPDALDSFGKYEEDAVYVRNDRLRIDYEILLDQRDYSEVAKKKPGEVI